MKLCDKRVIPEEYHEYYKNLKWSAKVKDPQILPKKKEDDKIESET